MGTLGTVALLLSFVFCGVSGISYFLSARSTLGSPEAVWVGRRAWQFSSVLAMLAFGILMALVITHRFEFAYVYENSSRDLPKHFLVSATWAGQEGSFLLWIVLNGLVGASLIKWARGYEASTMAVVALCQFFLLSMVLGLKLGSLSIGSSPFISLADKFPEAPALASGVVPADGTGLNDLLQNYWMVIHPPTLFVGFATMIVPFAFAVSALWKKQYTQWVRHALPWTLFSVMILGVGIAMGGYWAYVTLSFGGYWAWDPVENSSLVPWLIGIAAVHMMIIQKKSGNGHKAALFLSVLAYMLVVYSTFLTRSGILGDISVHSFVDLGLYNQLLLWIVSMGAIGFGLLAYRYRELPTPDKEPRFLSREYLTFLGAMLLVAVGIVIILGTSAPIIGRLFRDNPSTVPIAFYNKWSIPLSIGFVLLAGVGQLFWWNKMTLEKLNKVIFWPTLLAVVSSVAVLLFTPFAARTAGAPPEVATSGLLAALSENGSSVLMLLLIFATFFSLYGNASVLYRIGKGNLRLVGGALSHVGFSVMLLGIIASSGFSNPISDNAGVEMGDGNRENIFIEQGKSAFVKGYEVEYKGREMNERGRPVFIVDFTDPSGDKFTARTVVYKSNKDQWIQHPDVRLGLTQDVFVAVTPNDMFERNEDAPRNGLSLTKGEQRSLGESAYTIRFLDFERTDPLEIEDEGIEIAVGARLEITRLSDRERRLVTPMFEVMGTRETRSTPAQVDDFGLSLSFVGMSVDDGAINLLVDGVDVDSPDWIIVEAIEKPFINLVWIGIILITLGFIFSIARRAQERSFSVGRRTPGVA